MSVSVLIPVYCGSVTLDRALDSLAKQTFQDINVYINDDTPPSLEIERHNICEIIDKYNSALKISFFANSENLGYPKNLMNLVSRSADNLVFLLAQDDILSPIAIESCVHALEEFPSATAVSRPYYWFEEGKARPVRQISPLGTGMPLLVTNQSSWAEIKKVLIASSQLSGLMYQRSRLIETFRDTVFPAHIYPLAGGLVSGGVVFLPFFTVAVSITFSQTRHLKSIYEESPSLAWSSLYKEVFGRNGFKSIESRGRRDHLGKNFVGLIQVRVYGGIRPFIKEVLTMTRMRPANVIDPRFIVSSTCLLCLPPSWTARLSDGFKSRVLALTLRSVRLADEEDKWWN